MNILVEFKLPAVEGEEVLEEQETHTGVLMHFGISWVVHEQSGLPAQFTTAIVQDGETGQIFEMSPSEIRVI